MQPEILKSLNVPQTVFCLFFAIFWGLVANAQLRWKAFDWPLAMAGRTDKKYKPSRSRIWRSLWYLSLVPVLLFLGLMSILAFVPERPYDWHMAIQLASAVLAAHAAFAPYRLWLSAMERNPSRFYYQQSRENNSTPCENYSAQPCSPAEIHLESTWSLKNLCTACLYIVASALFACIAVFFG
jgi:hypothetical protein